MYAVIRAGGKQYRVAPGDVLRLESQSSPNDGKIEFRDVLAVSPAEGQIARPQPGATVTGQVLGQGRGKKVLVFHYKRKKQYKKLAGHRQPFTSVRITEIAFDGQNFTAPELPEKPAKTKRKPVESPAAEAVPSSKARPSATKKKAAPKKKRAAKKSSTGKKK
jgi:large subunit ribosomal protein L21